MTKILQRSAVMLVAGEEWKYGKPS